MSISVIKALDLARTARHSYVGHHVDGIDYLCLFRSELVTLKAYFFDRGSNDNVVVPHTHRYSFSTFVLRGSLVEVRYAEDYSRVRLWHELAYRTPYDGSFGFVPVQHGQTSLAEEATRYGTGESYFNRAHEDIHTIREVAPGTILLLTQHQDVGPNTTRAFTRGDVPVVHKPTPMSVEQAQARAYQLQEALS